MFYKRSSKTSSSDSYWIETLSTINIYLYQYGTIIICILGNFGNLLSIYIFIRRSWRKNVCVLYFLTSLFVSLFYLNFVVLVTGLGRGFNIDVPSKHVSLCKIVFYIAFICSTVQPTVLILACIDRLLISSKNVDTRLYSSKRLASFSIGISTGFWILFNIHILVKVNIQEVYPLYFTCYYDLAEWYLDFMNYYLIIFNAAVCLTMIILCIFSFNNIRHIRAFPRRQPRHTRMMTKRDFQLVHCLFIQNVLYIITSILPSSYSVYRMATRNNVLTVSEQAIENFLFDALTFLYFTFHATNVFVFIIISRVFRLELKRMLYKILGKNLLVRNAEINIQENIVVVNNIVAPIP